MPEAVGKAGQPSGDVPRREATGALLVASASALFGGVVVFGKFALRREWPVPSMLAIRFGIGAVILAIALVVLRRPLMAVRGERMGLALLAVGYAVEATLFFAALEHGTAAAVTLLFFTYPVLVTLASWGMGTGAPSRLTVLSLALAGTGTAVMVATGGRVSIERAGVLFALGSALAYTSYLVGADRVLRRTNPLTSSMWVSAGASIGLAAYSLASGGLGIPTGWSKWWPVLGMSAATAGAFVCLLSGLKRLGAVRTSIIAATEPLSSALLAFVFLNEEVTTGTALGGALILSGAVAAALARTSRPVEPPIP
ncbi:MAG TPA: DMT family transporter [Actinomycetota bacterium]